MKLNCFWQSVQWSYIRYTLHKSQSLPFKQPKLISDRRLQSWQTPKTPTSNTRSFLTSHTTVRLRQRTNSSSFLGFTFCFLKESHQAARSVVKLHLIIAYYCVFRSAALLLGRMSARGKIKLPNYLTKTNPLFRLALSLKHERDDEALIHFWPRMRKERSRAVPKIQRQRNGLTQGAVVAFYGFFFQFGMLLIHYIARHPVPLGCDGRRTEERSLWFYSEFIFFEKVQCVEDGLKFNALRS